MDLIDRQAAIDLIMYILADKTATHNGWIDPYYVIQKLRDIPSAQKTGKWESLGLSREGVEEWQEAQCSVCGLWHTTPYLYYYEHYKYCPNCGARMERE